MDNLKDRIKEKLETLLHSELCDLENEVLSANEEKETLDRAEKLNQLLNDCNKRENENLLKEMKEKDLLHEIEREKESLQKENEKKEKRRNIWVDIAKIAVPAGVTLIWLFVHYIEYKHGLMFEKEGTVSSWFVKDWFKSGPKI